MLFPMSQTQTPSTWCADLQAKLMAALDAAWALAETTDDPAVIAKARDKARLCGQMAAEVRKVAAMVPQQKPRQLPAAMQEALDNLGAGKPPAAQAMAMQAALKKLKRR
jgi:hypothetical protein